LIQKKSLLGEEKKKKQAVKSKKINTKYHFQKRKTQNTKA
jgi:hypothetical protein